jgi:hypothetical protein
VDPLTIDGNQPQAGPPSPRRVDGNWFPEGDDPNAPAGPRDSWFYDAQGSPIFDTGYSISSPGLGTIHYQQLVTLKPFNVAPRIVDDGGDFYTESPSAAEGNFAVFKHWNQVRSAGSYGGDFRYNFADTQSGVRGSEHTATWSFPGLSPGRYRVSISFPDPAISPLPSTLASDAEFTILDESRVVARVDIDQRTGADRFLDAGQWWEDLGYFDLRSRTLQVRLRDRADGIVLADAVRVERVNVVQEGRDETFSSTGGELTIQEDRRLLLDAISQVEMWTNIGVPLKKTFLIRNDGSGPLMLSDIQVSPQPTDASNYSLIKPAGLSATTPLVLSPGEMTFFSLTLDARGTNQQGDFPAEIRVFSNDYDEQIVLARAEAGIADPTDTSAVPRSVDPFTIRVNGVVRNAYIIDNGDVGFDLTGTWDSGKTGHAGDELRTAAGNRGAKASWRFTGLPDGVYRVSATWEGSTNTLGSTATPFAIADARGPLRTLSVNQSRRPDDFQADGNVWEDLGPVISLTGGTIVVTLFDSANQSSLHVFADAIRVERLYSNANLAQAYQTPAPDLQVLVDGEPLLDDVGEFDFGTTWPGTPLTRTFTIHNRGGAALEIQQPIQLPGGFSFISLAGNAASRDAATTSVAPGSSVELVVRLEAGHPGTRSGRLAFTTNDPDAKTVNWNVRGEVLRSRIIDNQDGGPNFASSAGFALFTDNVQGYQGRVHAAWADRSGDRATWTFPGLTPGRLFLVSAAWTPDPNRAPDAEYLIHGVTQTQTVTVNQQVINSPYETNGHQFNDLGLFRIDETGTLQVVLTDHASRGVVVADAIRIEAIEFPELEVWYAGQSLVSERGVVDFGSQAVNGSSVQTLSLRNVGRHALTLGTFDLPIGFSLVTPLPASIAAGGSISVPIRFAPTVAGRFGGRATLSSDELVLNRFHFDLSGQAFTLDAPIVDDVDAAFQATAGVFQSVTDTTSQGGRHLRAAAVASGTGGEASWTFSVVPGRHYRVATTWRAGSDRASNTAFVISGLQGGSLTRTLSQRVAPNDFQDGGTNWENLAWVTTDSSGILRVTLRNDTAGLNGAVIADAVRIEPILVINNEDPAPYFTASPAFLFFGDQGRQGSARVAANNVTPATAQFQFTNLPPGSSYRVSATWSAHVNRATNTAFTIEGTSRGTQVVQVNQERVPGSYVAEGSAWQDLGGPYTVGPTGTLTVTVANTGANEYVVADAIRLQPLPAQPELRLSSANGQEIPLGGVLDFGQLLVGDANANRQTVVVTNDGNAPLILDDASLATALQQLPQFLLVRSFGSSTLSPGESTTFELEMLTTVAGSPLATLVFNNNDHDENRFALTLSGSVGVPRLLLDDGDTGYSEQGPRLPLSVYQQVGFGGDVRELNPGSDTSASYEFTTLKPNTTYQLVTTWPAAANRSTKAPLRVQNARGGEVTYYVNQQSTPNDLTVDGQPFETIGWFRTGASAGASSLRVSWQAATTGVVIADAMQLIELVDPGTEIQVSSEVHLASGSTLDFGTGTQGASLRKTITLLNAGGAPLVLSEQLQVPAGFRLIQVSRAGLFAGSRTTLNADQEALTFELEVDSSSAGMRSGKLIFGTNDPDEHPYEINLIAQVVPAVMIIDNDGPTAPTPLTGGYSDSGNWSHWSGQGFQGDVREGVSGGAVKTATYRFTGLTPGAPYRVATTWSAFSNRTTSAPYAITGVTAPQTVTINQRVSPGSFNAQGVNWQLLGTFRPTNTELVVTLTSTNTGNVIADAVYLERIVGSEINVTESGREVVDGQTRIDMGTTLRQGTLLRTFTIENQGVDPLRIDSSLSLPAGFRLVSAASSSNSPQPSTLFDGSGTATMIAPGQAGQFTLAVETSVAGQYQGVLSFSNNDGNESPFNFTLTGNVLNSLIVDDGDVGFQASNGFQFYGGQGFGGDVRAEYGPNSNDVATWRFPGLAAGTYRVSASWSPYFNRATNAPYTITSTVGGGNSGTILVNQRLTTNQALAVPGVGTFVSESVQHFADLVTVYRHTGGDLLVRLLDTNINGWIVADAIRVAPLALIVDNRDADFVASPRFSLLTSQGYGNDVRAEFSPNGNDTATWTFRNMPAGTYRVSTTWSQNVNRATVAPYTIRSSQGGGAQGPVLVNQRLLPSDPQAIAGVGTSITDAGATFADLVSVYLHTGGDLTVTLSDTNVNGWIVADAVRVAGLAQLRHDEAGWGETDRVGAPQRSTGFAFTNEGSQHGYELSMLDALHVLPTAIAFWTERDATAAERLANVQVIIADLPAQILGLGSFDSSTIWLDRNAADRGWALPGTRSRVASSQRIDLVTVMAHELGHLLGFSDLDSDRDPLHIMAATLPAGLSRVPTTTDRQINRDATLAAAALAADAWPMRSAAEQLITWTDELVPGRQIDRVTEEDREQVDAVFRLWRNQVDEEEHEERWEQLESDLTEQQAALETIFSNWR